MVINQQRGFSLIELMIVVAIVALLAAFAYPSYQRYMLSANRAEARAELLELSAKLQRYKIANFTFYKTGTTPIVLSDITAHTTLPSQGVALYDLSLDGVTANSWTLTATPKTTGLMKGNGIITINSKGQKCWKKGQATCPLTDDSSWDES